MTPGQAKAGTATQHRRDLNQQPDRVALDIPPNLHKKPEGILASCAKPSYATNKKAFTPAPKWPTLPPPFTRWFTI